MAGNTCSGRKNWAFVKISISLQFLPLHGGPWFSCLWNCYFKVKNNNKLMIFIVFWKVISWILLFHLLFWCHKIIFRGTGYSTVFGTISRYWEQTLTIFDDVLLEEAAHAQLRHQARKSQKDWKNSVAWKKVKVCRSHQLWAVFLFFHGIRWIYASFIRQLYPY